MVYVDDMEAPYGRMKMCHMIADTSEELLAMADRIGVQRKWIQHAGFHDEHFDIALSKKSAALMAGAIPVTWMELGFMVKHRREHGVLPSIEKTREMIAERRAAAKEAAK